MCLDTILSLSSEGDNTTSWLCFSSGVPRRLSDLRPQVDFNQGVETLKDNQEKWEATELNQT